jgi:hypothetical protein
MTKLARAGGAKQALIGGQQAAGQRRTLRYRCSRHAYDSRGRLSQPRRHDPGEPCGMGERAGASVCEGAAPGASWRRSGRNMTVPPAWPARGRVEPIAQRLGTGPFLVQTNHSKPDSVTSPFLSNATLPITVSNWWLCNASVTFARSRLPAFSTAWLQTWNTP